jgi:hypothetical protein
MLRSSCTTIGVLTSIRTCSLPPPPQIFFHFEGLGCNGEHISAVSRMTQTLYLAEISLKDLGSIRNEKADVMESTLKDLPMLTEMRIDW